MLPKKPVYPLNYFCLKILASSVCNTICKKSSHEDIVAYFTSANYEVIQELLKNILNSTSLDAATRFGCLQLLLRQDVKRLEMCIFPEPYYEAVLNVITEKGTGIEYLNLKGLWVRHHPNLLHRMITRLTKLRMLFMPHMVNDVLIEAIVACGSLSHLDISGECSLSPQGLLALKSNRLTVLHLGNFGKKHVCQRANDEIEDQTDLVGDIIANLPFLTSLRVYSFTGAALRSLHKKQPNLQTLIRHVHDTNTTVETIAAMVKMCPALESLHIDTPAKGVLLWLPHFRNLGVLKLSRFDAAELMDYLKTAGDQIHVLALNSNKDNALDMSGLCVYAPNLCRLECYRLRIEFTQLTFFMCLQYIELLYCNVSDAAITALLANSPFLSRVVIGSVVNLYFDDIVCLCAECELFSLEYLYLTHAPGLDLSSVELLLEHCPNLRVLGQLTGWAVSEDEIELLRSFIKSSNSDLTILM